MRKFAPVNGGVWEGQDDYDTSRADHDRSCHDDDTTYECPLDHTEKCHKPLSVTANQGCDPVGAADKLRLTCKGSGRGSHWWRD